MTAEAVYKQHGTRYYNKVFICILEDSGAHGPPCAAPSDGLAFRAKREALPQAFQRVLHV